jgi:hypothetical protein
MAEDSDDDVPKPKKKPRQQKKKAPIGSNGKPKRRVMKSRQKMDGKYMSEHRIFLRL